MHPLLKILGLIALLLTIALIIMTAWLDSIFGNYYNTQDLIENYEKRSTEILELKNYMAEITPADFNVYIEFRSRQRIDFSVNEKSESNQDERIFRFHEWNINPYQYEEKRKGNEKYEAKTKSFEEATQKLNWQADQFKTLKAKLDKANCISIDKSKDVYTIGFQRSGMGKYHYKIFESISAPEIKERYDDGCHYKYYKENIALEYLGGAIGMECFEDFTINQGQ